MQGSRVKRVEQHDICNMEIIMNAMEIWKRLVSRVEEFLENIKS